MAGSQLVRSLLRGLDILEAVGRSEDGLTLQALAGALEVAPPTAHNLARTLMARGYLEKRRRPTRYRLGPAALALTDGRDRNRLRRRAEEQVFPELARRLPKATLLWCEARGGDAVVVLRAGPERPGVIERPAQMTMPPYHSASSLALLAFQGAEEREATFRRYPFEEFGRSRWGEESRFEAALGAARRRGWAAPEQSDNDRMRLAAAPVWSPGHALAAVIGMSAYRREVGEAEWREHVDALIEAAAAFPEYN